MKRVVLDASVVASACFWRGVCWHCLEAWVGGRFTALVSPPIVAEYTEVFERLRQRYPDKPCVDWVAALRDDAELAFPTVRIPDEPFTQASPAVLSPRIDRPARRVNRSSTPGSRAR